jgi:hypothetical protein
MATTPTLQTAESPSTIAPAELALLVSVFVIAACGLVYELAADLSNANWSRSSCASNCSWAWWAA